LGIFTVLALSLAFAATLQICCKPWYYCFTFFGGFWRAHFRHCFGTCIPGKYPVLLRNKDSIPLKLLFCLWF